MKKLNIQITLATFLFAFIFSVGNAQNWTQQSTSTNMHNWMEILHVDIDNNVYCEIPYADTVIISDTSFIHPGFHTWQNAAISVYTQDGDFVRAFDFHTLPNNSLHSTYVTTDDDLNLYVAAEFSKRVFIQDTVINHGPGPNPDSPDIFLLKLNKANEVEWAKIITSETQDRCFGLLSSDEGFLYMAVSHGGHGTVKYLGQDTVAFDHSLFGILKTTMDGEIVWRKSIQCTSSSLTCRNFFLDENENVFFSGYTKGNIVVGTDTLFIPGEISTSYPDFILEFDKDGNLIFENIVDSDLSFSDMHATPDNELFFAASVYKDTAVIGTDTIFTDENTRARLVGKMDINFQPVWYHVLKAPSNQITASFVIDFLRDTLYSAIAGSRKQTFAGTEYDLGIRTSTLLIPFDVDGQAGQGKILKAKYNRTANSLMLDHCNNLLLSGKFRGEGWFGDDTLQSFHTYYDDGYISKFYYAANQSIDIGGDTAIGKSYSISIAAPDGYDNYYWSTGFEGQVLTIEGSEIDTGYHKIWCDAIIGKCIVSDTMFLTVYDDTSIDEINSFLTKVYPNPFSETISFQYHLTQPTTVDLIVYNLLGEGVEKIKVKQVGGVNKIVWQPNNLPNGIYFYRLTGGKKSVSGKILYGR